MPACVIQSWKVNHAADPNGEFVNIKGRSSGLLSWLLSLMGIQATVSLRVSSMNVTLESISWSGRFCRTIPLSKISSVFYGYSKPWKQSLFLLFALFAVGIVFGFSLKGVFAILVILATIIYYVLNKQLTLGVVETSGCVSKFDIKRSIVEGHKLDENDAEIVENIILRLIESKN